MTIGEKIKYFRTKKGITQTQLAELSELHPVSIRKYEAGHRNPKLGQLQKIATALGINAVALTGVSKLKLETPDDVSSALMLLIDSGIMQVYEGVVSDKKSSTISLTLNPKFSSFITIANKTDNLIINLEDIYFKVKEPNMLLK